MEDSTLIPYGYELCEAGLVRADTGEVVPYRLEAIPEHSTVDTPSDKERRKRFREEQEERNRRTKVKNPFVFVKKEIDLSNVAPAMVTKLVYLSTYMKYDGNKLMLTNKQAMTRNDLADVLGISPRNAVNFWNSLSPDFLYEDDTGALYLNSGLFKRGKLAKKKFLPYQRIFNNGVRKLYAASNGKNHKQMGYLFQLLPYISVEYNVLCRNPYEKDINAVELLSISDFCKLIGYSVANIDKLKRIYNGIRFPVGDHTELFCKMIYDGVNTNDAIVCINPNILYSGSNPGRVEVSKLYFRK